MIERDSSLPPTTTVAPAVSVTRSLHQSKDPRLPRSDRKRAPRKTVIPCHPRESGEEAGIHRPIQGAMNPETRGKKPSGEKSTGHRLDRGRPLPGGCECRRPGRRPSRLLRAAIRWPRIRSPVQRPRAVSPARSRLGAPGFSLPPSRGSGPQGGADDAGGAHPHLESPQFRQVMHPSMRMTACVWHFMQSCAPAGNSRGRG